MFIRVFLIFGGAMNYFLEQTTHIVSVVIGFIFGSMFSGLVSFLVYKRSKTNVSNTKDLQVLETILDLIIKLKNLSHSPRGTKLIDTRLGLNYIKSDEFINTMSSLQNELELHQKYLDDYKKLDTRTLDRDLTGLETEIREKIQKLNNKLK